jgi:hypothetical protein
MSAADHDVPPPIEQVTMQLLPGDDEWIDKDNEIDSKDEVLLGDDDEDDDFFDDDDDFFDDMLGDHDKADVAHKEDVEQWNRQKRCFYVVAAVMTVVLIGFYAYAAWRGLPA